MTQEHQGWNCATEAVSPTNITLALIDTCQQCRPAECVVVSQSLLSHASFMQTWDCCIFHHSVHITYFPTQIGISDGNFITICASVRFHYLDHLVASRMAPSMCPEHCGTRLVSSNSVPSFRHIFGVYVVCIFVSNAVYNCHA